MLIVFILIMIKCRKNNVKTLNTIDVIPAVERRLISYQEILMLQMISMKLTSLEWEVFVLSSKEYFLKGHLLL